MSKESGRPRKRAKAERDFALGAEAVSLADRGDGYPMESAADGSVPMSVAISLKRIADALEERNARKRK